jgi:N-acetylmuramoyl-L-alanine amidase
MLVLHYTGMPTAEQARNRLCDPEAKVSAHYLIDTDGHIDQLVDEAHRAWHAGVAWWRGNVDINARSIGIELVNPGHEHGYRPFPSRQMAALRHLATDIVARHSIPQRNVVGHSDVAPTRKTDPGELFDWRGLAEAGIGLWCEDVRDIRAADPGEAIRELATFGYDIMDTIAAIRAFQRHFRPSRVSGCMDTETAACLAGLLRSR